jgi:hypothetical protein
VLLPLAFTRIWDERSRLLKVAAAALAAAIGVGIALTFSRGAALGFGLTVLIMIVLRYVGWRQAGRCRPGCGVPVRRVPRRTAPGC